MITQDGLTSAQVDFFNENGYLVLPDFVDDDACLKLRAQAMVLAENIVHRHKKQPCLPLTALLCMLQTIIF